MSVNELHRAFCELSPHHYLSKEHFSKLHTLYEPTPPPKHAPPPPSNQTKSDLNLICKQYLGIRPEKSIRTEIAIAQMVILTHGRTRYLPSIQHLQDEYFLSSELFTQRKDRRLVEENKRFPLFVYNMREALCLFNPKSQMDFICNVVACMSRDTMKVVTGGGTERISTTMRCRVFEIESGYFRPKTRKELDNRVRQAGLLLPIPPHILKRRPTSLNDLRDQKNPYGNSSDEDTISMTSSNESSHHNSSSMHIENDSYTVDYDDEVDVADSTSVNTNTNMNTNMNTNLNTTIIMNMDIDTSNRNIANNMYLGGERYGYGYGYGYGDGCGYGYSYSSDSEVNDSTDSLDGFDLNLGNFDDYPSA